jgi:hypothetical protein
MSHGIEDRSGAWLFGSSGPVLLGSDTKRTDRYTLFGMAQGANLIKNVVTKPIRERTQP